MEALEDLVQLRADVPRQLKRRAFAILALREERFNRWLALQLEALVKEGPDPERAIQEETGKDRSP